MFRAFNHRGKLLQKKRVIFSYNYCSAVLWLGEWEEVNPDPKPKLKGKAPKIPFKYAPKPAYKGAI